MHQQILGWLKGNFALRSPFSPVGGVLFMVCGVAFAWMHQGQQLAALGGVFIVLGACCLNPR